MFNRRRNVISTIDAADTPTSVVESVTASAPELPLMMLSEIDWERKSTDGLFEEHRTLAHRKAIHPAMFQTGCRQSHGKKSGKPDGFWLVIRTAITPKIKIKTRIRPDYAARFDSAAKAPNQTRSSQQNLDSAPGNTDTTRDCSKLEEKSFKLDVALFNRSSRYFLQSFDHQGAIMVANKFIGEENRYAWSNSMKLSLVSCKKLGFIDGNIKKPADTSLEYDALVYG